MIYLRKQIYVCVFDFILFYYNKILKQKVNTVYTMYKVIRNTLYRCIYQYNMYGIYKMYTIYDVYTIQRI